VLVHALDPAAFAGVAGNPDWPSAMLEAVATEDLPKVPRSGGADIGRAGLKNLAPVTAGAAAGRQDRDPAAGQRYWAGAARYRCVFSPANNFFETAQNPTCTGCAATRMISRRLSTKGSSMRFDSCRRHPHHHLACFRRGHGAADQHEDLRRDLENHGRRRQGQGQIHRLHGKPA